MKEIVTGISQGFRETIKSVIDDMLLSGEDKLYDVVIGEVEKTLVKRALELTRGQQGQGRVTARDHTGDAEEKDRGV